MRAALLALLLCVACSSSSDLIETEYVDCAESGNMVSVMLYGLDVERPPVSSVAVVNPAVTMQLEVSNNTHEEIVVKRITIMPRNDPNARFALNSTSRGFNETIPPGKEHVFELVTTGSWRRSINDVEGPQGGVEVQTRVELENGQTYRCAFSAPLH